MCVYDRSSGPTLRSDDFCFTRPPYPMEKELIAQAQAWAETEDYTQGLRLWLARYGENITYRALCRGANDFNRAKLRTGLLAGLEDVKIQTEPLPVLEKPEIGKGTITPPEIMAWKRQTEALMDERLLLKQRLRELPDPERRADRKTTAYRIIAITDELDELFGKIGYWEDFGRVPAGQVETEAEAERKPQGLLNLRTYVSRTKAKIRKATDPVRIRQLEAELLERQAQIHEIEMQR